MTHAMTDNGKILIFDSDTTAVQSLKQSAEKFGFHCISTSNSLETIDLVSKERPDIIFTDFPLHGDNGFSLLEEVKDLDPNILIIILAANGTIESAIGTKYYTLAGKLTACLNQQRWGNGIAD